MKLEEQLSIPSPGPSYSADEESQETIMVVHSPQEAEGEKETGCIPSIPNTGTFDSSEGDNNSFRAEVCISPAPSSNKSPRSTPNPFRESTYHEVFEGGGDGSDFDCCCSERLSRIVYISVFGAMGAILRIFIGRLFGSDCDHDQVEDFLTPLSSRLCVTTNGKTEQTGGALFTDLPADMLGSFLIGLLSPAVMGRQALPWFRPDHPLQGFESFHTALKVGLCGCLTTFASWNTQMVVMLDGSYAELGTQVAPALFGYFIGVCCSVANFLFGRHVYEWLRSAHHQEQLPTDEPSTDETADSTIHSERIRKSVRKSLISLIGIKTAPFLLLAALTAAFVVGDVIQDIPLYRKMWLTVIFAPCGALLRWRLSKWNDGTVGGSRFSWVPWGTLTANLLASFISIAAEAVQSKYVSEDDRNYVWESSILQAVEAGFAGSLSTVSTMIKEMFDMQSPAHSYVYVFGTILLAMFLNLAIYSPIVRS